MIKNITKVTIFLFCSLPLFGTSANQLNNQLAHLQTQIKAVKLSWQKAEKTLSNLKNLLPTPLYQHIESKAKKILTSANVASKMKLLCNQQKEAIVKYHKEYTPINFLADYFPEIAQKLNSPMKAITITIANKTYRLLLLQKLLLKEKEELLLIQLKL